MWQLVKEAGSNWVAHKDARLGAALAYYSIFSIGPLIVIAIAVAGLIFGQEAVRGEVSSQIRGLLGDTGAAAVETMLASASRPKSGILATLLGVGALLVAAVGVVVQLKDASAIALRVPVVSKAARLAGEGRLWMMRCAPLISIVAQSAPMATILLPEMRQSRPAPCR